MPHRAGSKQAKTITASDAAALVRSGDWIDYGVAYASPTLSTPLLRRASRN